MSWFEALILGIVQGITEFLPVSSSGHLELAKAMFQNVSSAEESMMMTIVLHFATALSTVVIFRKDILILLKGLFQFKRNEETEFFVKIVLSMIPAVFVGLFFEKEIEQLFIGNVLLVGFMLILTAFLLWMASKAKDTDKPVSFFNSIIIGVSQAIAILPGVSRSGATIATSVIIGNDKSKAARFSFLMVIPLIFGKIVKDLLSNDLLISKESNVHLLIGFLTAFFVGLLACKWMIKLIKNGKLVYFAYYCFVVGTVAIMYHFF